MRVIWLAFIGMFLIPPAHAQTTAAPKFVVGDTWVVQRTVERGAGWQQTRVELAVVRATADLIAISDKVAGSTVPPTEALAGMDWSRSRSVNGRQTVINRPLLFPLATGKTWVIDYTEINPNRQHSSEHFRTPYKVTGWEDVTVPAGNFHALKIEAEGEWEAVVAPAIGAVSGSRVDAQGSTTVVQTNKTTPTTTSGRTYKAFWYVPEVKRWVKSVEEYYSSGGVRNERFTEELVSFKPSS
jgi:hypothetical protein